MDGFLLRYNKNVTYALFDAETFNLCLSFHQNRVWQAGVLKVKGEKVLESHDIRISTYWPDAPHLKVGEGAAIVTRFNQIQHDKVAIDQKEAFYKFWPLLKEVDYIIMHNGLKFDLYLLRDYARYMGEDWKFLVPKIIDTKSLAQGLKMNILYNPQKDNFLEYQYRMANIVAHGVKTRLSLLAKEYGIEVDENRLHEALYDLTINLKVWDKMKYQVEI